MTPALRRGQIVSAPFVTYSGRGVDAPTARVPEGARGRVVKSWSHEFEGQHLCFVAEVRMTWWRGNVLEHATVHVNEAALVPQPWGPSPGPRE